MDMAKKNKYNSKPRREAGGQSPRREFKPVKPANGDGECHIQASTVPSKQTKVMQTVTEPVAAPEVHSPPSSVTWVEPDIIADNSSYATADSEDAASAVATPPAVASMDGAAKDLPAAALLAVAQSAMNQPAAEAVVSPTPPSASPAGETTPTSTLSALTSPSPVPDVPEVSAPVSVATQGPALASTVLEPDTPATVDTVKPDVASTSSKTPTTPMLAVSWAGFCIDWLLKAYTYPVYLTAGVTVGLVTGMIDQLPGHSRVL